MAGSTVVTIRIEGMEAVSSKLKRLSSRASDMAPVMGDIGKYLSRFFSSEVFASRGAVIGERWQPLNARYAVRKAKRYPGRPPLVRTGLMQRSFRYASGATFARVSNSAPYFDYHQLGGSRIPERVMMKVDEARTREIGRLVEKFLGEADS
jgi:phage gpG-like protein